MTLSGPQKYPGASTAYWYQNNYPGNAMEVNVGVMHTTEGISVPTYSGGSVAPNFTAKPDIKNKRLVWYQHFDFDRSARALVNLSGGVETNTLNVVQIELVGTCDPTHRTSWSGSQAGVDYLFWPEAPDWALQELAKFVKWAHDNHNVKLEQWPQSKWIAYPGSYGTSNGQRMTNSQWLDFNGWCGHQHVPENVHGDPGNLRMDKVLAYAKGETTTTPPPTDPGGTTVALSKDDIKTIAGTDGVFRAPEDAADYSPDPASPNHYWSLDTHVFNLTTKVRQMEKDLSDIKGILETLSTSGLTSDQVSAIATAVADVLHNRLSQ